MARSLCAFFLAFAIAGAPVGASLCRVTCASHDIGVKSGHAHHHSAQGRVAGAAMNAVPHTCQHQSKETVGLQQAVHLLTAPVFVVVPVSSLPLVSNASLARRTLDIEHGPPGILALTAQLRV
jgi:hypothetical protein